MMNKDTPKLNRTVFELWIGIIIFSLVCEIPVVFVPQKLVYSVCLLVGMITSFAASFHMWWSIDYSLGFSESEAVKKMSLHFVLRYIALIIVLGVTGLLTGAYVLATFAGIMGMKAAAYMEPITKKISVLIYGEEILPPVIEYIEDEDLK